MENSFNCELKNCLWQDWGIILLYQRGTSREVHSILCNFQTLVRINS